MAVGFVYILLNPAFPDRIKIGRTSRPTRDRANELSRQTGVPEPYIVVYDQLVGDCQAVEDALHERFAAARASVSKEFFRVPSKEAILALQEFVKRWPVPPEAPFVRVPLFQYFRSRFGKHMRPEITDIALIQYEDTCALEIDTVSAASGRKTVEIDDVPIGFAMSESHLEATAELNAAHLRTLDEYGLIMVTNLFTGVAAQAIADQWEKSHVDPP